MTFRKLLLCVCVLALLLPVQSFAGDVESLLEKRSAILWFEGEEFGELIIGARAQFAFVYVDGALSQAVVKEPGAPDWLRDNIYYYGTKETRKKALFIVRLRTVKSLDLQLSMIKIGTHTLTPEDVLTNKHYVPVGELPPDFSAAFAVAVPLAAVKGTTRTVSVGDYGTELEFPIR